jgi:ABC-2 type transport system ATP-binding protein
MNAVHIENVSKSFGNTHAVADVSFSVARGEIFGLLGPNGAGKTTLLRIMLDIFKPDRGKVEILGGPMTEEKFNRIGYMPEDRGLYQNITLERCLVYLASLKGIPPAEARQRLKIYLERFDLAAHKKKKVKELSKGMQQKAQVICTLLHEPEIILVDEPFSGLDPINTQMIKDLMREMRDRGATIVMCTHMMRQVEELCDRIILVNQGQSVLYGNLNEIRRRFSGHAVLVRTGGELPRLPGVKQALPQNNEIKLTLEEGTSPQEILRELIRQNILLEKFEIAIPSLDEIFIRVVKKGGV